MIGGGESMRIDLCNGGQCDVRLFFVFEPTEDFDVGI